MDVTQAQQQKPELPTVTSAWRASNNKVHKLHKKYNLFFSSFYPVILKTQFSTSVSRLNGWLTLRVPNKMLLSY